MDDNTKDILEAIDFIKNKVEHLPTKDEVREMFRAEVPQIVREETKDIRAELTSLRRDVEALSAKVDNISGLPKEIDHAFERIAAIERHLGIERKIAA